ncbi:MAG: LysM peptidoglycan-binding domain-containing protein [Aggregatilineales bacterium]
MRGNRRGCGFTGIIVGLLVMPVLLIMMGNATEPRGNVMNAGLTDNVEVASANVQIPTLIPSWTPVPATPLPTHTFIPVTGTSIPPTPTLTYTFVPPTPLPASSTPTYTFVPPTPTLTYTFVPPTAQPSSTPIPATTTPVPPTPTQTYTFVPPTIAPSITSVAVAGAEIRSTTVPPGAENQPAINTDEYGDDVIALTHLMQPGETLYWVSLRYHTPIQDILDANDVDDESDIYSGQRVVIPVPVNAFLPDTIEEETEVVVDTDTIPTLPPTAVFTAIGEPPDSLNGVALDDLIQMSSDVKTHIREVYQLGQTLGRDSYAFSKTGDCNSESPHYLTRFDEGGYNLADYSYLESTIEHFSGSYERQGMAVHRGFHSWTVFDPFWASPAYCQPNESPIDCELRLNNPSVMLIRLGTNDKGVPDSFDRNMRDLVEYLLEQGVIPVLGTKADRFEGMDNINNRILQDIAGDYKIPLWDFDRLASTLPGRGLGADGIHMTTYFAHDYSVPVALQRGHSAQNLSALMVLDSILRTVISDV